MARFFLLLVIIVGVGFLAWYGLENGKGLVYDSTLIGSTKLPSDASYKYVNATSDTIFVTTPKPGEVLTSLISLTGFARGNWYSEAVFPIEIQNPSGDTIYQGQARAQGEWTTTAFVPFSVSISLDVPYSGAATIILKNDNPSGDPARDASVSFPVIIQ